MASTETTQEAEVCADCGQALSGRYGISSLELTYRAPETMSREAVARLLADLKSLGRQVPDVGEFQGVEVDGRTWISTIDLLAGIWGSSSSELGN